jgi:hypothetical protein
VQSATTQHASEPTQALGTATPHTGRTRHTGREGLSSVVAAIVAAVALSELAAGEAVLSLTHHGETVVVA